MTSPLFVLIPALLLSACSHLAVYPPALLAEDELITQPESAGTGAPPRSTGMSSYSAFNAALKQAQEKRDSTSHMALLEEGMHLVTATCIRYLNRLGKVGQHASFARKETSLANTLAASTLGLAGASATAIAGTASAFGFSLATLDNYSDSYLFAPDISAVQALVLSAMDSHKAIGRSLIDSVTRDRQPLSYTEVNQFLLVMQTSCQPHGIRGLVTQSVAGSRVEPDLKSQSIPTNVDEKSVQQPPNDPARLNRSQLLRLVPIGR
jgi:hypothetical protein